MLLVALAVLAYGNAFRNGFVLDDIPIIVENPLVRDVGNVGAIFETNYWHRGGVGVVGDSTLYRPLTVFTYAVDYALWGPSPSGFHATNVILHAAVTALVFLIAVRVLGSATAAFATAAIFAVHPLHTEAVTGIVGRAEVLAALFFLAAFLALRRPTIGTHDAVRDAPALSGARIAAGALLYLLALFSKEVAVTLPAVLALDDWLRRARGELPRDRSTVARMLAMRYGALALAAAVYFAFRTQAVHGGSQIWPGFLGVSASERTLTASRVLLEYVALFVFPRTLLADYWKTDVSLARSLAEPLVVVSLIAWVGVAVLIWRRRRDVALVLSVVWFFITIAPVSNVFFPIGVAKAERILYLPSVGLCLVAGWLYGRVEELVRARGRSSGVMLARGALATILVALTARTLVRNRDWRDNLTLATSAIDAGSSSPLMYDIAAGDLVRRGDAKRATDLLREAVRQAGDKALYWVHLGVTYYNQGLLDDAIAAYREATRIDPRAADAHNNLGVVYLDRGRVDEAEQEFRAAVAINANYVDPRINLGLIHLDRGQYEAAAGQLDAAVRADPTRADARNALGVAHFRMGQLDRAAEEYREALRLRPDYEPARANLARVDSARAARR